MKNIMLTTLALCAALITNTVQACTAGATPVSPSATTRSLVAGQSSLTTALTVSINCTTGETYTITSSTSNATSAVGTSGQSVEVLLFGSASYAWPSANLTNAPISGTASATGTTSVTVYAELTDLATLSTFNGFGAYSASPVIQVQSSGGATFTITYNEAGTMSGICIVGNPTVNFGTVTAGTPNPIQPVALALTCTSGMPLSISQPSTAYVTIGSTTNTAWIYSNAGGSIAIQSTPITTTGTGAAQIVSAYVGLSGATMSAPIAGTGLISGALQYVVSF